MPDSKRVSLTATLIATGAAARIVLAHLALSSPPAAFGILIKVGLTETLTFVDGFLYGPILGFVTGASIIVISDMLTLPGEWTPFIAAIIGLIGVCSGLTRRVMGNPGVLPVTVFACAITVVSEVLQNAWVAFAYNVPFLAAMLTGVPSLLAALVNNVILFPTVGLRVIKMVRQSPLNE